MNSYIESKEIDRLREIIIRSIKTMDLNQLSALEKISSNINDFIAFKNGLRFFIEDGF
jgi:hypothetical protein